MSNKVRWAITFLAIAVFTLLVYLCAEIFGITLGFVPTFVVWGVIYALGRKWTKKYEEKDGGEAGKKE